MSSPVNCLVYPVIVTVMVAMVVGELPDYCQSLCDYGQVSFTLPSYYSVNEVCW